MLPLEIQKLMKRKEHSDAAGNIIYNFMVHFHQPYSEIMRIPMPVALEMLKRLDKENKNIEKENKRIKK
jgi:hypothetical protein